MNKSDLVVGRIYEDVATGEPVEFIGESKERGEVYFGPASPESIMCAKVFLSEHVSKHIREIKKTRRVIVELPTGIMKVNNDENFVYAPSTFETYTQFIPKPPYAENANFLAEKGLLFDNHNDALAAHNAILNCLELPTDHEAAFEARWEAYYASSLHLPEIKFAAREFWKAAIDYLLNGEEK